MSKEEEPTHSLVSRRNLLTSMAGGLGLAAVGAVGTALAPNASAQTSEESAAGEAPAAHQTVTVQLDRKLGAMKIDRFALGQGGFSSEPMFPNQTSEVRSLKPRVIRLFVQEYYDLLPETGQYHFTPLDASIDLILQSGATPLLCMVFKPRVLFPRIDQDLVTPTSWEQWDALISKLVRHYKERNGGGWYWEVGNEFDLESGGGTPYHMTPQQYTEFYRHTALAVRKADPEAHVGGPAQARVSTSTFDREGLIPALVSFCSQNHVPLDFISWHGYQNDPKWFGATTRSASALLGKYPDLHVEKVIDEWNIALGRGYVDPRLQPAFVAEATYQMVEAGLDLSCYYQIRDYPFAADQFAKFYPPAMIAEQEIFWDRRPVYLGLFDYEGRVRPAYFVFRLLERLTGERVKVDTPSSEVHALATVDDRLKISSILMWNYSPSPAAVDLRLTNIGSAVSAWRFLLNVAGNHYNQNLVPQSVQKLPAGNGRLPIQMEPWAVTLVSLESH